MRRHHHSAARPGWGALVFALGLTLGAAQCGRTEYECHIPGEKPTYELKCGARDNCLIELSFPVDPPSVLIALDRSCSMKYVIDGQTKWDIATESLISAVATYPELWWGAVLFPDDLQPGCDQGAIPVQPGPAQRDEVIELLGAPSSAPESPCNTNLAAAVRQIYEDERDRERSRRGAILLISDGQIGCSGGSSGSGGSLSEADMLRELYEESGVQTFVLGFGDEVDEEALNELALAGGAPAEGPSAYYVVGLDDFEDRLLEVLSTQLDCEYEIGLDPDGLEHLTVRVDDSPPIPRSSTNGWEYDAERERLVFSGRICRRLERFEFSSLELSMDCRALPY